MNEPLPSLNLSSLRLSPKEVACAFHLPLSAVLSPPRLHPYLFRAARPYFAIDVSDFISASGSESPGAVFSGNEIRWTNSLGHNGDKIGGGKGRLEVWGLTGWYLTTLLRILGVYEQ